MCSVRSIVASYSLKFEAINCNGGSTPIMAIVTGESINLQTGHLGHYVSRTLISSLSLVEECTYAISFWGSLFLDCLLEPSFWFC